MAIKAKIFTPFIQNLQPQNSVTTVRVDKIVIEVNVNAVKFVQT